MTAIGAGTGHLALLHLEVGGEFGLQTGRVEGGEGRHLAGLQAGVQEHHQTGQVGRVEDNDHVLNVRAILLDILTELLCDLAVAFQEVFAGHAGLAGGATGRDDVFCVLESNGGIRRPGEIDTLEGAMVHFGDNAFQTGLIHIIEADVRSKLEHHGGLRHVGTNHAGSTDDDEFLICQKSHNQLDI